MNERIRNLAEHCDFYVGNEHYNESHEEKQRLWVEKFAKLIVKECINKVRSRQMFSIEDEHNIHHAFDLLVYDLESHFGVEE